MAGVRIGGTALASSMSIPFSVSEDQTHFGYAIWRIINGTPTRITEAPVVGTATDQSMSNPRLSPDGSKIAFDWNWPKPDFSGTIAVVNALGGTPLYITPDDGGVGLFAQPSWHPDGDKVIYIYCPTAVIRNKGQIEAVDITGSGTPDVLWTPDPSTDRESAYRPQYSPDGSKIAFIVNVSPSGPGGAGDLTRQGLWVMNADGSGASLIDPFDTAQADGGYGYSGTQLAWGNLGNYIVYSSGGFFDSTREIYKINADGTGKTQLSNGSAAGNLARIGHGAWNAADDGVFSGIFESGTGDFAWALSADGSTQTKLDATHFLAGGQNFSNVYRHTDNRLYFIHDTDPPLFASIAADGSDYQETDLSAITSEFISGDGIEWS